MTDITTILVDDEQEASDSLEILLSEYPKIKILRKISNPIDIFPALMNTKVDLIFLDIKMPNITGIELLSNIREYNSSVAVVFVTAFDNYAMNAVKLNAFSYLLKPICRVELKTVVGKILNHYKSRIQHETISNPKKILIKSKNEILLVEANDVVYLEAEGNYTGVYLKNGETIIASYHLGSLVEKFSKSEFVKANRSLIINKNCILSVNKKEKTCVVTIKKQKVILNTSNKFLKELKTIF